MFCRRGRPELKVIAVPLEIPIICKLFSSVVDAAPQNIIGHRTSEVMSIISRD